MAPENALRLDGGLGAGGVFVGAGFGQCAVFGAPAPGIALDEGGDCGGLEPGRGGLVPGEGAVGAPAVAVGLLSS